MDHTELRCVISCTDVDHTDVAIYDCANAAQATGDLQYWYTVLYKHLYYLTLDTDCCWW
jgi:hypothetical protein